MDKLLDNYNFIAQLQMFVLLHLGSSTSSHCSAWTLYCAILDTRWRHTDWPEIYSVFLRLLKSFCTAVSVVTHG